MPWRADRLIIAGAAALTLGSCIQQERVARPSRPLRAAARWPLPDDPVKIGPAYTVRGVTYQPRDERDYDAVGLASWYSTEAGDRTANGETFRPHAISAAHKTLPLPSYVEVTVLETGRTLLVRVNDRGPFYPGRVIDLSEGAAAALDLLHGPPARVRVRRVEPSAADRLALRTGRRASYRPDAPSEMLAAVVAPVVPRPVVPQPVVPQPVPPQPVVRPPLKLDLPPPEREPQAAPAAALPGWFVQVAAFGDRARADALLPLLDPLGGAGVQGAGSVWRVRIGPYDERRARAALAQVQGRGYQGAVLVSPHRPDEDMLSR